MTFRLTKIDEVSFDDHHYLETSDECWYFGEYTATKGWSYSDTNRLIKNFKKEVRLKSTNQWQYKLQAINKIANLFSQVFTFDNTKNAIIVPVPPSKIKSDPEYDSRVLDALSQAAGLSDFAWPIVECVHQKASTIPNHQSDAPRLSPLERAETYVIDSTLIPPGTTLAYIVDDVITSGSHYKGMELALKKAIPSLATVRGVFVARRVQPNPFENFEAQDLSNILRN